LRHAKNRQANNFGCKNPIGPIVNFNFGCLGVSTSERQSVCVIFPLEQTEKQNHAAPIFDFWECSFIYYVIAVAQFSGNRLFSLLKLILF